jgi:hypothetical protein
MDRFALWFHPTGTDTKISTGTLSKASFNADLTAAVDAAHLAADHAVLFTPDAGGFAGRTFLIVDANSTAGYQAGDDLVILLKNSHHINAFDVDDFL